MHLGKKFLAAIILSAIVYFTCLKIKLGPRRKYGLYLTVLFVQNYSIGLISFAKTKFDFQTVQSRPQSEFVALPLLRDTKGHSAI